MISTTIRWTYMKLINLNCITDSCNWNTYVTWRSNEYELSEDDTIVSKPVGSVIIYKLIVIVLLLVISQNNKNARYMYWNNRQKYSSGMADGNKKDSVWNGSRPSTEFNLLLISICMQFWHGGLCRPTALELCQFSKHLMAIFILWFSSAFLDQTWKKIYPRDLLQDKHPCQRIIKSLTSNYTVTFRRVRKISKSDSFVMSVRPSVWNSAPHRTDFHEIWYLSVFIRSVQRNQVSLKCDKNKGHFKWRPMYIYDNISLNSS